MPVYFFPNDDMGHVWFPYEQKGVNPHKFLPVPENHCSIIWGRVAHVWLRASGQHFWSAKKYFAAPKIFIVLTTRRRVGRADPVSRGPMKIQLQIYINLILSVWPCFPLPYLATCTFGPLWWWWYHAIIYHIMHEYGNGRHHDIHHISCPPLLFNKPNNDSFWFVLSNVLSWLDLDFNFLTID